MNFAHDIVYFLGGAFLTNAVPHFVSGVMGHPFQSPFAKPPGKGLSTSTVNVVWGFFCFTVGFLLVDRLGSFDWKATDQVIAAGLGAFLVSLMLARTFGRLHGGNLPAEKRASP
jgi:uncharacterized PurR-regulated membrane protein YhhQ (DUF165 family)